MKNDKVLAGHILDAISHIEEYSKNMTREEFLSNFLVQDAVVRNIEIIGEASKNISQPTKDTLPDVPWRDIIAMRNMLIHEYFRTDGETVWNVIEIDLPNLKAYALRILNSTF